MQNKIIDDETIENMPYILSETSHTDGMLEDIFAQNMANLKKFGEVLRDSAKLIGSDIGFLVKLTFSRLKKVDQIKQMKEAHFGKRNELLKSISSKSNELMDTWPDGRITSMMVAPGLFFTNETLSGMGKVTSPEFRQAIGEFGFDSIPVLGPLAFGKDKSAGKNPFAAMQSCEPGDGECMKRAFDGMFGGGGGGENKGVLSKLATSINNIFLISHYEPEGTTLFEGDDPEDNEPVELTKEQEKFLRKMILQEVNKHLEETRKAFLEDQTKYYDKVIQEAEKVLTLNSILAGAESSKDFVAALDKLKKMGGDSAPPIDIQKVKEGMSKMAAKVIEDEESMKEIKKEFEENDVEPSQDDVNEKVEEVVLSSMKGQFLQELKNSMTDYYEEVYSTISGGVGTDELKILSKDEQGKEFVDQVESYQKKLKDAISKLERS